VEVVVPIDLSDEEADTLRTIAEARGEAVEAPRSGLFSSFRRRKRKRG
jgi:hypothetical protein